jgi:hypothetical protein
MYSSSKNNSYSNRLQKYAPFEEKDLKTRE